MDVDAIRALPFADLADTDCALFLWVTAPCLMEGLSVPEHWGFTYKTVAFVRVKQKRRPDGIFRGPGHWTRANAGFCLPATKGSPKRASVSVRQVTMTHIEEHSRKPQEAKGRIVRLMGDILRLELFARTRPEGWDVWGNEAESDISLGDAVPAVKEMEPD